MNTLFRSGLLIGLILIGLLNFVAITQPVFVSCITEATANTTNETIRIHNSTTQYPYNTSITNDYSNEDKIASVKVLADKTYNNDSDSGSSLPPKSYVRRSSGFSRAAWFIVIVTILPIVCVCCIAYACYQLVCGGYESGYSNGGGLGSGGLFGGPTTTAT